MEKRKNDEETEEGWVQCDVCDCWVHQICGLFNKGRNKEETPYVCPMCLLNGAHPLLTQTVRRNLAFPSIEPFSGMDDSISKMGDDDEICYLEKEMYRSKVKSVQSRCVLVGNSCQRCRPESDCCKFVLQKVLYLLWPSCKPSLCSRDCCTLTNVHRVWFW